jgi:hypothetical protein
MKFGILFHQIPLFSENYPIQVASWAMLFVVIEEVSAIQGDYSSMKSERNKLENPIIYW